MAGAAPAPSERLAAASGVALVLLMLLDWFGGRNAWQLKLVDVLLLALAVLAVGLALGRGGGREPAGPGPSGLALTVAGAVAVGVMLTLVVESSGGTVPLVLSLVAAGGILGGGLVSLREAANRPDGGRARRPHRPGSSPPGAGGETAPPTG